MRNDQAISPTRGEEAACRQRQRVGVRGQSGPIRRTWILAGFPRCLSSRGRAEGRESQQGEAGPMTALVGAPPSSLRLPCAPRGLRTSLGCGLPRAQAWEKPRAGYMPPDSPCH